ncbi:hypothetical protein D5125_11835 [Magnetovirga frankeli]|nr:hypothetical protein D5125_11835 [gamma proteobacterium SS-5]
MIALTLGLIVVGATIAVFISTLQGSSAVVRSARLNHDMDSLMSLMTNDIRRAGYWGGAGPDMDLSGNPFMTAAENIQIIGGNCIVYSYDANRDGHPDIDDDEDTNGTVIDENERYGFRLNNDGSVSIRLSATTTASCTDGNWERITLQEGGEDIQITNLQFTFNGSTCDNFNDSLGSDSTVDCSGLTTAPASGDNLLVRRVVTINMAGASANDAGIGKIIQGSVTLPNDRHILVP